MFLAEITYTSKVCPYIFRNTNLKELGLYEITRSLILMNTFEFIDTNKTNSVVFNMNTQRLEKLILSVAFERISFKMMPKNVFENVKIINLHGIITGIDESLFESFKKLRLLLVNSENFRTFFYQAGTKWINAINSDIKLKNNDNIKQYEDRIVTLVLHDETKPLKKVYAYTDEDICLFKNFPHLQLVYPVIMIEDQFECSCSLTWLTQFYRTYKGVKIVFYKSFIFGNRSTVEEYCTKKHNLSLIFRTCNFTSLFEKCMLAKQ
jgi:hypothetical protein